MMSVKIVGVRGRSRMDRVAGINRVRVGWLDFVRQEDSMLVGLGFMVSVVA